MVEYIVMNEQYCKHCRVKLITKQTRRDPSQLKKQYYYTAYYYCPNCKRMYLNDRFKIVNKNFQLFTTNTLLPEDIDVTIWTDGACSFNGTGKAKAAWAFVSGEFEKSDFVIGKQTNNTAEGYAIYHALLWAKEKKHKRIKIISDSQITLHNLQKPPEKIKENKEIFAKIFEIIKKSDLQVIYEKVAGHAGDINNERADKLANQLVGIK